MSIAVRRVTSLSELKTFVRFPVDLYRAEPHYVPTLFIDELNTLRRDKNPAFEFCEADYFLAFIDNKIVGRIAVFVNQRSEEKWGKHWARFGWIDFIEDIEVAKELLSTAEEWARERACVALHGPLGFTDMDREGMLVEGFDEVATLATIYNKKYYSEYLEQLGYKKDADWVEYRIVCPTEIPEKVRRVQDLIAKRSGVRIYPWRTKKELVERFGKQIFNLLDEAYAKLYGTTPLSERQVQSYIDQYLGFVDPRFTKIILDTEEKLIGFAISMPSLSEALIRCRGRLFPFGWYHLLRALKNPKLIDLYLVAVKEEYQARGVVALLMGALIQSTVDAGVRLAESNPELETNIEVQSLWKGYERHQHKRRRVYLKELIK
ncbi:hypothetical protein MASR2M78_36910 [Treponema sp.]